MDLPSIGGLDLDRVKDVVSVVWDNKDDITHVLSTLPDLFDNTAKALSGAAEGISATSSALIGEGGQGGVAAIAATASKALEMVLSEINGATDMLKGLGEDLSGVPLMDAAGAKVQAGAERFTAMSEAIEMISKQLGELSGSVEKAGSSLTHAAENLAKGGQALGAFSSR